MHNHNKSAFKSVFSNTKWSDDFYRFLQVVFHLYPEDKFHHLIKTISNEKETDEEIYKSIQLKLPTIKPFLSELTFALPALRKQKNEMSKQVLQILGTQKIVDSYLEIGSTGRYISDLKKYISINGNIYITNDMAPDNSLADIFERGQFAKIGKYIPLTYQPISEADIASESVDLITCHIGLHHCTPELLDNYIKSLHRILKKGAVFIMRDHDVQSSEMATFVSLVHTVFNLGLGVSWEKNALEFKSFKSIDEWSALISSHGFKDSGHRLLQFKDPSLNTLVSFTKV